MGFDVGDAGRVVVGLLLRFFWLFGIVLGIVA